MTFSLTCSWLVKPFIHSFSMLCRVHRAVKHSVVMTTRIVLVTACLVAMATLVAPQCRDQFPEPINEKKLDFVPLLKPGETIGLILGIGSFAFLIAILYIVIR